MTRPTFDDTDREGPPAGRSSWIVLALLAAGVLVAANALNTAFAERERLAPRHGHVFTATWIVLILSFGLTALASVRLARAMRRGGGGTVVRRPFAHVRLLLYIFMLGTVGYLIVLQPYDPAFTAFFLSLVFGAFAGLELLSGRLTALVPGGVLKTLDVVLMNLCVIAILGELGLRVLSKWNPQPIFVRPASSAAELIEAYRFPAGEVRAGFPCNSRGHYDEEFAPKQPGGERVVVCIGDSFSQGSVPHHFHFTTVCERALPGTRVFNMGVNAIGPPEYLLLLEQEALPLRPDAIVIDLFVGNDIEGSRTWREREVGFFRSFLDRRNLLLALLPGRIGAIVREQQTRADEHGPGPLLESRDEIVKANPWVEDPLQEIPFFTPEGFMEIEVMRARAICSEDRSFYSDLELMLERLAEAAGATPLFVMIIPDEFQVEDAVWREVVERLPGVPLERDQPQRLITEWLTGRGIPHLDLLAPLRAAEPWTDGRRHVYALRDTHFNARGNRIAGEALARFLGPRLD